MAENQVTYGADGAVASITLNRPEVFNALTDEMFDQIVAFVRQAEADDDVKCIVLAGAGRGFTAGFDLSSPDDFYGGAETKGGRFAVAGLRRRAWVMRDLLYSAKPIVARVHGPCIGAGLYLVLVCDFAVVTDDATFGLPEERFGSAGTSWLYPMLASQIGLKRANELVVTGRKFDAAEAERLGLVNRVVPADQLDEAVAQLTGALASLPRDGIATGRTVAHMAYDILGIGQSFTPHYGVHPLFVMGTRRSPDEFDFHETSREKGMKGALAERDERFGGDYWGW
ncbi:MAG: enoyl-CoA hydratase/isomerase family protein [bacterium]|nr:enoyl-CoA hydratase/isomerase family protein [bacterium]